MREKLIAVIIVLVIGGAFGYMNYRIDLGQCDEMMRGARTHADTLVVESTSPFHDSMSCYTLMHFFGDDR